MDVERNVSGRAGCYSDPNNEYARDIEGKSDVDVDYKQDEIASEQASSHDAESRLYLGPNTRYQSHVYEDEDDLSDGLPLQVHSSRTTGRDRRGMYVPAYEKGPILGNSVSKRMPSGDCDNFSGSGDSERRSDRKPIHFEKVFSFPPAVASQQSTLQSERAETETISSPLPRQLVLKGGSKSSNEDTPTPSSLGSPFASASVDRGESLVIESGRRCEITIKPKSSNAKLDSSHGSKYQSTSSSVSSSDGDKPASGKNQANRGRPTRRMRNGAVPVVHAVVSDIRKVIQAQVIEVKEKKESKREETFSDETETSHGAEKLRKLERIILNNSQLRGEILSPEDEDSYPVHEAQESYIAAVSYSEDELKEADLPMEEESNSGVHQVHLGIKEEEFNKTDDDMGVEYDKSDDRNKVAGEFDTTTAVAIVVDPSVASDGESTTPLEGNFSSNLQRQGSIRPHQRKPKDSRRKVATSSQLPIKLIQAEEHKTLKSSQVKNTNALKLADLTSLSSSTSQRTESVRVKTGMEKLKKKTTRVGPPVPSSATIGRNIILTADSMDPKSPEASQDIPCDRFNVLLRRDERGYGMTMESTKPVVVQAVRPGGVAEKSGILPGDALVKINGTYVFDKDHDEVIKLIKSAGPFLDMTLQREVRSYGGTSVHDENLTSTIVQSQSLSRLTKPKPNQTQTSQSFTSGNKRKERDSDLARGQGETSAGGKRNVNRGGNGDAGLSYYPAAEGQNLVGKDSTLPHLQSTAKSKAPAVETKLLPKPGGEVGGGAGIIGMEFDDLSDEGDLPIDPAFSDVAALKQHNGHLAVFLKFLISYSEPAPMLFSMITDYYYSAVKDVTLATRWAFEIYTTFLVSDAPLKLSVDDGMVSSVQNTFKNPKENELRTVFRPVENFVRETILVKELKDLHKKLGIGMLFGALDLKPNMDRAAELKIVDSNLSKHFEEWLTTEGDTKQALAFCLATFFRQIGFTGGKYSALLETCPSFIYRDKDKKILKYKLKKNYESKGHTFNPYQCMSITKCQNCETLIWGIGYQAYQCTNCDLIVHRRCADDVWQLCSGTLRRHKDPTKRVVRVIGSGRSKIGREEVGNSKSVFHVPAENLVTTNKDKPAVDAKVDAKVTVGEKVSDISDADQQSESDNELHTRHLSWPKITVPSESASSTLPKAASNVASSTSAKLSDSDFEIEPELPPLSQVLSKEAIRKLKGKERKKQEYINELFYTEKTHLRSLKVIDRYFLHPMKADGSFEKNFINRTFANLDEVIELHNHLNKDFKALRLKNEIVNNIGDVLVSRLSGEKGTDFKQIASTFCQDQLYTLKMLKDQQKQNPKLAQILQEAALNGYCARQELKDLLPREMQRLTKYPLLIENICNCTPGDTEEHEKLTLALKLSKELLEHVNHAVRDCENFRRTQDMQVRLDRRPIENSKNHVLIEYKNLNLTQHKMIYDGELTWRRQPRSIILHVALFEHFIVLLQKQDDRLVLRCQNMTIENDTFTCSPIIKLEHLLTKDVATDKRAFFLINKSNDDPHVYELGAKSKEEKNRWCSCVKEAVERYHKQYSNEMAHQRLHSVHGGSGVPSSDTTDNNQRTSQVDGDPNESVEEFKITPATELIPDLFETLSPNVDPKETFTDETENASILLELQEKDAVINEALSDKVKLLADSRQASCISDDLTPQAPSIDEQNMNVEDLLLRCKDEVVRLSQLGRGQQTEEVKDSVQFVRTAEGGAGGDVDGDVVVSATELIRSNQKIHRLLELLAVKMVDSEDAEMENKGMELNNIKSRLSAMLGMAADDKNFAMVSGAQKPILRPTSYIAALSDTGVNSDHMIHIRPEEDSPLQLLASTMDNMLLSDDRSSNRATTDQKSMALTPDVSAKDNVSFI